MSNLYWIGSRESDIKYTNFFKGSICLYGETETALCNRAQQRIDNDAASPERDAFVLQSIQQTLQRDENAQFYFYDPSWAYDIDGLDAYRDHFVCVNTAEHYALLNNKIAFYRAMQDKIPLVYATVLPYSPHIYADCNAAFGKRSGKYILQKPLSNGGNGTYILTRYSAARINKQLDEGGEYLFSIYYENSIPVNAHFLICDKEIILLPGSIQLMRPDADRLRYRGADFDTYSRINDSLRKQFEENARIACTYAQSLGYRGVCGIDGIIAGDKVMINEFNCRFQASTALLNKCLHDQNLPSVQEFNLLCFSNEQITASESLANLKVPFSMYIYHNADGQIFGDHILKNAAAEPYVTDIDTDGYHIGQRVAHGIYMFRICIRDNLSSINPDGGLFVHENVAEPNVDLYRKVLRQDKLAVKISLMTLGVKLEPATEKYLLQNGGIRPGNNNAVDMNVLQMVVNAPRDIKFIAFAPFVIRKDRDNGLKLYYYNRYLTSTKLYPLDPLGQKTTSRGVPYGTVAYLSTDRLRVHMTNECIYKRNNSACRFCNIVPCEDPIDLEDLREVINDYVANSPAVHHFLVGGQSMNQREGMERITEICRMIRAVTPDKHIYVMALPYNKQSIKSLVEAGMNEIACNIEIFDDKLAKQYMPGKGAISRSVYYRVLSYAKTLLPEPGSVRTMLIYGLEPNAIFLKGIRKLAKLGIQPIISIFRPLPNTDLEKLVAPPLMDVYKLYYRAEALCEQYSLRLGPSCTFCQNNTLSLPETYGDLKL